jgi:hypothetical protein
MYDHSSTAHGSGTWYNSTTVTGFRIQAQTGNVTAGKVTLYGIKNS